MMMNENVYLVDDDLGEISSIHNGNNYSEDELYSENIDSEEEHIEEDIETNITNYSVDELTSIFSIPLPLEKQSIKSIMEKLENETDSVKMKTFYNEVTVKLLNYVRDNEPKPMTIHPVIEGYVNPHMKQIITKMICIDSQFRKDIFHPSHDYTNDLSERVSNVMSVHLNHVEIPNTWYVFNKDKNNTTLHFEITYEFKEEKIVHYDEITLVILKSKVESMYLERPQIVNDNTALYSIYQNIVIERYKIEQYIDELNTAINNISKSVIDKDTTEINLDKYLDEDIKEIFTLNTIWNRSKTIRDEVFECLDRNNSKKNLLENILTQQEETINQLVMADNSFETKYNYEKNTFTKIDEIKTHIVLVNNDVSEEKGITDSYFLLIEESYKYIHDDIQKFNLLLQKAKTINIEIKSKNETETLLDEIVSLGNTLQNEFETVETYYKDHYTNSEHVNKIKDNIIKLEDGNNKLKLIYEGGYISNALKSFKIYDDMKFFFHANNSYSDSIKHTYYKLFNSTYDCIYEKEGNTNQVYKYLNNQFNTYTEKVENINNHIESLDKTNYESLWKDMFSNKPKLIGEAYNTDVEFLSALKSFHKEQKYQLFSNITTVYRFQIESILKLIEIYKNTKSLLVKFLNIDNTFTDLYLEEYPKIIKKIRTSIDVDKNDIPIIDRNIQVEPNVFLFQPDFKVNRVKNVKTRGTLTAFDTISSHTQSFQIEIPNGNYLCSSLAEEVERNVNRTIQNFVHSIDILPNSIKSINKYVNVNYNSKRKTCSIEIIHSNLKQMNFTFSDHAIKNEREFLYREKVLGHYLGFSNKQIFNGVQLTYDPADVNKRFVESEELMNTFGTKYIYVCMDDFLQNKTTTNIIGLETTRDNLKVPSYYHCDLKQDDYRKLKSEKKSGLTEVKAKAMKSIQQDNLGQIRTKWKSVDDINVFAKIPVKYSPVYSLYDNNEDIMMIQNDTNSINHDITKRDYFGPVELNKVRVYLLDDDGEPLNLNNENWSLSLVCKQNYQG